MAELLHTGDHGHGHGLPVVWILGGVAAIVVLALLVKAGSGASQVSAGGVSQGQLNAYQNQLQYAATISGQNADVQKELISTAAQFEGDRQKFQIARQQEQDSYGATMRGLDIQETGVKGQLANQRLQIEDQLAASKYASDAQVSIAGIQAGAEVTLGLDSNQKQFDLGKLQAGYAYKLGDKKLDYDHSENMTSIGDSFQLGMTKLSNDFTLGNKSLDYGHEENMTTIGYHHEETMDQQNKSFWGGVVQSGLNFLGGLFALPKLFG